MENELMHWGVQGMHWGERRYQNPDGSLTPAGRIHYGVGKARDAGKTVGKAVGKAAVKTGKVVGKAAVATGKAVGKEAVTVGRNVVYKHMPKVFMSDEQLARANVRVNMERMMLSNKKDIAKMHRGRQVLLGILEDGVKALSKKGFEKLGSAMFDREEEYNWNDIKANPEGQSIKALRAYSDYADVMKKINGDAPVGSMKWIGEHPYEATPEQLGKYNKYKNLLPNSTTGKAASSTESKSKSSKSSKSSKYTGATSMDGTFKHSSAYSTGKAYVDEFYGLYM